MTTVELQAIAARASLAMPAKATGFRLVTDVEPCSRLENGSPSGIVVEADGSHRAPRTRFGVAWITDARLTGSVIAWFDRQADAHRLLAIVRGDGPTSRARDDLAPSVLGTHVEQGRPEPEAPDDELPDASLPNPPAAPVARTAEPTTSRRFEVASEPGTTVRLCAGCNEPLPADARPNRTAHNAACRERARYHRAAEQARTGPDGATAGLTLSHEAAAPSPTGSVPAVQRDGRSRRYQVPGR